ncbi:MAG: hypothetical protein HOP08_19315 [Cyclobacteriaceae bacterium]|nr:hypothetical protein [Cyclobacteriaceae bacterium]
MRFILLFLITLILIPGAIAQNNKKITFETKGDIIWAGVDRPGDLFLVLQTGEVLKYDKQGKKIGSHSFKGPPTLLDPLDGVQSFYYMVDGNHYGNISSDLMEVTKFPLDPAFAINPWLVAPSLHELWILDSADFSIKKTKMKSSSISLEAILIHLPTKKVKDYVYMREYQNYLFLLDKNSGIHLYNALGKFVKTFGEKDLTYFNFLGEEIYFMKDKQLIFLDLFNDERRFVPLPMACKFALINEDKLYAVESNRVTILDFKPY